MTPNPNYEVFTFHRPETLRTAFQDLGNLPKKASVNVKSKPLPTLKNLTRKINPVP
jgi:hypothetical protein